MRMIVFCTNLVLQITVASYLITHTNYDSLVYVGAYILSWINVFIYLHIVNKT